MDHLRDVMQSQTGSNQLNSQLDEDRNATPEEAVKNSAIFWDQYVKEADVYDTEMVKGMTGDLDTLLIFAGLFSAVNTAFIVDSFQDLRPDAMEGTNALLRRIIQNMDNTTFTAAELAGEPFTPGTRSIAVNQLFFSSLSCSLFAAFGAVLGKQWLNEYQRAGRHRSPFSRSIRRHQKFLGMGQYQFDFIIQTLPTLLQLSLFLFLVALVVFLWDIDRRVSAGVIAFTGAAFLFYSVTTVISTWDSTSPFSTRLSAYINDFLESRRKGAIYETMDEKGSAHSTNSPVLPLTVSCGTTDKPLDVPSECVAWMKENATSFNSASAMARTAIILPTAIRKEKGLLGEQVGPIFITSILSNNALELGTSNGTLSSTLAVLLDVVTDWKPQKVSSTIRTLVVQLHSTLRFIVSSDHSSCELVLKILGQFSSGASIHQLPLVDMEVIRSVLAITSLDDTGRRMALVFLWARIKKMDIDILMELLNSDWFKAGPGKLLESTMWLDPERTESDPDEEMLRFRLLWHTYHVVRSRTISDYPPYHRNLTSLSSYLGRWIQTHPNRFHYQSDLLLSELIKVIEAAHGLWSLSNNYPLTLSLIAKMFAEDGHIAGAVQWVANGTGLGAIEALSPCFWAYHVSTNEPPCDPIPIPEAYFITVISLLELQPDQSLTARIGMEIRKRVGVDLAYYAMPTFFKALCWLIEEQKALIQPSMVHALSGLIQIADYMMANASPVRPLSKGIIDGHIRDIAKLFGEAGLSYIKEKGYEAVDEANHGYNNSDNPDEDDENDDEDEDEISEDEFDGDDDAFYGGDELGPRMPYKIRDPVHAMNNKTLDM